MMYQEKFVVAIKHGGKVLREVGDVVKLPFGSEFTVLVKNLNNRRAKFNLHIDGTDVLDGTEIIVNANSEVEMKRFIRNGNMDEGNAYKFIERTRQIEDGPRGIKADDGIVRVEFWFEKISPIYRAYNNVYKSSDFYNDPSCGGVIYRSISDASTASVTSCSVSSASSTRGVKSKGLSHHSAELNDAGITVPGSKVEQKFTTVYGFNSEPQSNVIVLRLVGRTAADVEILEPVTTKTKQKCQTCGHMNKVDAKFCNQCGTALELF